MKNLIPAALASAMVLSATSAYAGGQVVIEEEAEVVAERPASSGTLLPLVLGIVILAVALNDNDDEEGPTEVVVVDTAGQ